MDTIRNFFWSKPVPKVETKKESTPEKSLESQPQEISKPEIESSLKRITVEVNGLVLNSEEKIINYLKQVQTVASVAFIQCQMTPLIIETLKQRVKQCGAIKELFFQNCFSLTNQNVEDVVSVCALSLEKFKVKGPSKLTDQVWKSLLPATQIESVSLSGVQTGIGASGFYSFLKLNQKQIKKLNINLYYSFTPFTLGLSFPKLESVKWCNISGSDLKKLKEDSPNLSSIATWGNNTFNTSFVELFSFNCLRKISLNAVGLNVTGLEQWKVQNLQQLTLKQCTDQVGSPTTLATWNQFILNNPQVKLTNYEQASVSSVTTKPMGVSERLIIPCAFEISTTALNPPSIDRKGICYFVSGTELIQFDLVSNRKTVIQQQLKGLTSLLGSQCAVYGEGAILASAPVNGSTSLCVDMILKNESFIPPIELGINRSVTDVEIGSYKGSSGQYWPYAMLVDNSQDQSSGTAYLKVPTNETYDEVAFPQEYSQPLIAGGCSSQMVGETTVAIAMLGSTNEVLAGTPVVFYVDLVEGNITQTYKIPLAENMNTTITAITGGEFAPYPVTLLSFDGEVFYGPVNNEINSRFHMGKGNKIAYDYRAIEYVNKETIAFFARDTQNTERYLLGFYNCMTKEHISQVELGNLENKHLHMVRLLTLYSGKVAVGVVSQDITEGQQSKPNARVYIVDAPKSN